MKQHTSVILFSEWKRPLSALSLEQKGRILDALLDFPSGTQPEFSDPMLVMAWSFMLGGLEENARKWDETRARRAEAGRRGAEVTNAQKHVIRQTAANPANADFVQQNPANPAVSGSDFVSDTDSGTGSDTVSVTELAEDAPASPSPPVSPRFEPPELEEVTAYFTGKGGTAAQAQRFRDFYESNGWRVGQNPMKSWQAAASVWMARDKEQRAAAPRGKAFLASRPPEEAAAHNWLKDCAIKRKPLKKRKSPDSG